MPGAESALKLDQDSQGFVPLSLEFLWRGIFHNIFGQSVLMLKHLVWTILPVCLIGDSLGHFVIYLPLFCCEPLSRVSLHLPYTIPLDNSTTRSILHLHFSRLNKPSSFSLFSCVVCAPALWPSWWTSSGFAIFCQWLSCTEGPETGHSIVEVFLQAFNRGEQSSLLS